MPPYGITNKEVQPDGADVDVAKLLAKDLGVTLEIVSVNGASRIPTRLSGKADVIISSFSIGPERANTAAFSIPYGEHQNVIVGEGRGADQGFLRPESEAGRCHSRHDQRADAGEAKDFRYTPRPIGE